MFQPSYLSAAGPHGAYGADDTAALPAESTPSAASRLDKAQGALSTAQSWVDVGTEASDLAKGIGQALGFKPKKKTTTTTAPVQDPYKALLTPEEYARLTTTCKFSGKLTDIKAVQAFAKCRKQTADQLIAARSKQTASLTGQTLTTEEKDYTWYYVGGTAALAATGLAVWWFKFRK
jgi:hypothetical protein